MIPLLDPHNDLVFKLLFAGSPSVLSDLINAIRGDDEPIEVLEILNPRIEAEEIAGKFIVLDILARDAHGTLFNMEMQMRQRDPWSARSAYYLAKALVGQLKQGENYENLKPVVGIHLLGFDLFADPNQALWCFELRDRRQPQIRLGRELQPHIVELCKADRLTPQTESLAAWIAFFQHSQEESRRVSGILRLYALVPSRKTLLH